MQVITYYMQIFTLGKMFAFHIFWLGRRYFVQLVTLLSAIQAYYNGVSVSCPDTELSIQDCLNAPEKVVGDGPSA